MNIKTATIVLTMTITITKIKIFLNFYRCFYRAMHMQRIRIAQYMLPSVHLSVTRWCICSLL